MAPLLMLLAVAMIGLAGFLVTPASASLAGRGVQRLESYLADVFAEMYILTVTPRMVSYAAFGGLVVLILFLIVLMGPVWGLVLGLILGLLLPVLLLRNRIRKRRTMLESQLLDGLITLANGMRAGLNLPQALGLIEKHGKVPLKQEFGLLLREIEHGTSVDVALERAGRRIRSHNFRLLFAAMRTTRLRGGNLPDTLDRLGTSLREIVRLEEKVKSQTAQHRTTAIAMGIMPSVFLGIYYLIDSEGVELMFTDSIGQVVLAFVIVLNVAGFLWIRSIVNFEI